MTDAERNLRMVAKALHAELHLDHYWADVKINGIEYRVSHSRIDRLDASASTCIQNFDMPWEERIASTLLLLHYEPSLFNLWRTRPGKFFAI